MTEEEVRGLLAVMGFELMVEKHPMEPKLWYAAVKRMNDDMWRYGREGSTRDSASTAVFGSVTRRDRD